MFHRCCECAMGWPEKLRWKIAGGNVINGHDRKQRGNNAEEVEILHRITSRMLPAKHIRLFCARAPMTNATTSASSSGACLLPGAFRACRISTRCHTNHQQSSQQNRQHRTAERLGFIGSSQRKAFFKKQEPVATPPAKPMSATYAFRSPADIRSTMRSGQPERPVHRSS